MSKDNFGRLSCVAILSASFIAGCGGRDAASLDDFERETAAEPTTDRVFEAETFASEDMTATETLTTLRLASDAAFPFLGSNSLGEDSQEVEREDETVVVLDAVGDSFDITLSAPTESIALIYGADAAGTLVMYELNDAGEIITEDGVAVVEGEVIISNTQGGPYNYGFVNLNGGNGGFTGITYRIVLEDSDVGTVRIDEIIETDLGSAPLAQDLPLELYRVFELGDPDDTMLLTNGVQEFNAPNGEAGQSEPEDGMITSGAAFNITGTGDGAAFVVDSEAAGAVRMLLHYRVGPPVVGDMLSLVVTDSDDMEIVNTLIAAPTNSDDWGGVQDGARGFVLYDFPEPLALGDTTAITFGTTGANLLFAELFGPAPGEVVSLGDPDSARLETNGVAEFNGDPAGQAGQSEAEDGEVTTGAVFNVTGGGDGVSFVPSESFSSRIVLTYLVGPPVGSGLLNVYVGPSSAESSTADGVSLVGTIPVDNNSDDWGVAREGASPTATFELGPDSISTITTAQRVFIEFGTGGANLIQVELF